MAFHPDSLSDLTGRTYIVTGGNSGIGRYTVAHLARKGAHVYMGSRSAVKAEAAIQGLKTEYPDSELNISHLPIDHLSLTSVIQAAKQIQSRETSLHGLINNAGIMATPYEMTTDGYDIQFQTNYLAHWLLTHLLLPLLRNTARQSSSTPGAVRIVNVSSIGHQQAPKGGVNFDNPGLKDGSPMERYGQSKLAQILHADTLHRTYGPGSSAASQPDGSVWTTSLNPGLVQTNLGAHPDFPAWMKWIAVPAAWMGLAWTSDKGSWTSLYCAASEQMKESECGKYFVRLANSNGSRTAYAKDAALAEKLEAWTREEMRRKGFLEESAIQ